MGYPLSTISSLSDGNLTVNGTSTYFSIFTNGDQVTLNEQTVGVNLPINDTKFTVATPFTSGVSGDMLYVESKCVWLKYQIWRLELAIANYDVDLLGLKTAKNGSDEIVFNTKAPISELMSLKADYERQLTRCRATESGSDPWIARRLEYGTL